MDVLCVGHAAWDISVFVDGFPAEESKSEIRTMIECGGGPAANAAYLLARWGVSCGIVATGSADRYGDRIREEFLGVGADVTALRQVSDCPTPLSIILVNAQREPDDSQSQGSRKKAAVGIAAHCDGPAAGLALRRPRTQSLAPGDGPFPRGKDRFGRRLGSRRHRGIGQARGLPHRFRAVCTSVRRARRPGKPAKSGRGDGGLAPGQRQAGGDHARRAGNPVRHRRADRRGCGLAAKAVDTTAAGDIFHGAFVYGVLTGLDDREKLRLAAAAAALSVAVRGGRQVDSPAFRSAGALGVGPRVLPNSPSTGR